MRTKNVVLLAGGWWLQTSFGSGQRRCLRLSWKQWRTVSCPAWARLHNGVSFLLLLWLFSDKWSNSHFWSELVYHSNGEVNQAESDKNFKMLIVHAESKVSPIFYPRIFSKNITCKTFQSSQVITPVCLKRGNQKKRTFAFSAKSPFPKNQDFFDFAKQHFSKKWGLLWNSNPFSFYKLKF